MKLISTLTFLSLCFLISCQNNEFPEERMFEPIELVGRYCGVGRYDHNFIEEFSVEIVSHDTLLLIGNFDNICTDIKFFIRNDSLIFPRQIRYWTNQSPGGSTWEEWKDYQGKGVFYPEEKIIDIDIERNKEVTNHIVFQYTLLGEPVFDMSGMYSSIDASTDSARIRELGDGDSLEISLFLDYQHSTDSLLRCFRIENPKCEDKRIYIDMKGGISEPYPHYRLEGRIHLVEDSAIIKFDTLVWLTSGAMTHRGPYYSFNGVKIK